MMDAMLWSTCTSRKYSIGEQSVCDGVLQNRKDGVDSPYDKNEDGNSDDGNPNCEFTYDIGKLDCNDTDLFSRADKKECNAPNCNDGTPKG
jgi:hypothetical protein